MRNRIAAAWIVSLSSLVGCTSHKPKPTNLSCLDILTCADGCASSDTACSDDCVAEGSPLGVSQVSDLVACNDAHACNADNACLQTSCAAQIAACTGSTGTVTGDAKQQSGFDSDDEGWTIVGDAQSSQVKPDFNGTGGNPGGLISADDDVAGGTWYFQAPPRYLGDNHDIVGKTLRFDVKVTPIDSPFGNYDVVIGGGGVNLAYNTSPDPGTDWTTYTVPLSAAGWKVIGDDLDPDEVDDADFAALPDATDADFAAVLGDVTTLRIRGEFNDGPDTGSLDNVRWGE